VNSAALQESTQGLFQQRRLFTKVIIRQGVPMLSGSRGLWHISSEKSNATVDQS
jgi:hypothetical protein